MSIRRGLTSISVYVILLIFGLFFLVPLLWPVLASFNPSASLSLTIPAHFSLINFQTIITSGLVARPFTNSLILAISTIPPHLQLGSWQVFFFSSVLPLLSYLEKLKHSSITRSNKEEKQQFLLDN